VGFLFGKEVVVFLIKVSMQKRDNFKSMRIEILKSSIKKEG